MEISSIESSATRMRDAIEALPRAELPLPMQAFPCGACGDASLLLGAFLADSGHLGFMYTSGERGSLADGTWTSHGWLARGALVVDITADQFPDSPARIIVGEHSIWHQQFEIDRIEPSDFRTWNGPGTDHLHAIYARLNPFLTDAKSV